MKKSFQFHSNFFDISREMESLKKIIDLSIKRTFVKEVKNLNANNL